MKPETYNSFLCGIAVGYAIRHFIPPREIQAREWIVSGILIVLALGIRIWANIPLNKKNKKSEQSKKRA